MIKRKVFALGSTVSFPSAAADCVMANVASARLDRARRCARAFSLAMGLVLVGSLLVACDSSETLKTTTPDGTPLVVTVPSGGKPKVSASSSAVTAAASRDLPVAVELLSEPVHIKAGSFSGTATITFTWKASALPASASAIRDLTIASYDSDVRQWVPRGGVVDTDARTISVDTTRFSDWVLASTDPDELEAYVQRTKQLDGTTGGKIANLITGGQQTLTCGSGDLLLDAAISNPAGFSTYGGDTSRLCERVADNGDYELQWANDTGLPIRFEPRPGFHPDGGPPVVNEMAQRIVSGKQKGTSLVRTGDVFTVTFPGDAVDASTVLIGKPDFTALYIATGRAALNAALGAKAKDSETADRIDDAALSADLVDCYSRWIEKNESQSQTLTRDGFSKDLAAAVKSCKDPLTAAGKGHLERGAEVAKSAGKAVSRGAGKLAGWAARRLTFVLSVKELLSYARNVISGIPAGAVITFGGDLDVRIKPSRFLTYHETTELPVSRTADFGTCQQLEEGSYRLAGSPTDISCITVTSADLDGNGKNDRLITWTNGMTPPAYNDPERTQGIVAYLDDNTFHLLEDPDPDEWAAGVGASEADRVLPGRVVHLGSDPRQQVLVTFLNGANTGWFATLSFGADKRLRALPVRDGVVGIPAGGGVSAQSGFGCVRSEGTEYFTTYGQLPQWKADVARITGYSWGVTYYELTAGRFVYRGRRGGWSPRTMVRNPQLGEGYCDPGKSPQRIGPVHPGATSDNTAVSALLQAAEKRDTLASESFVDSDSSWRAGAGKNAWKVVLDAISSKPTAWVGQPVSCSTTQAPGVVRGVTARECIVTSTAGARMTLLTEKLPPHDDWVVAGAVMGP